MKGAAPVLASIIVLLEPQITEANKKPASLPTIVQAAKTIYVENQTTEAELQNTAYMELTKWGRFQIVDSPKKADCVLRISNGNHVKFVSGDENPPGYEVKPAKATPSGEEEPIPPGFTRIDLIDPKTGNSLWADQRKTNSPETARHLLDGFRNAIDQQEKGHHGK
jgi:hypothetical protein